MPCKRFPLVRSECMVIRQWFRAFVQVLISIGLIVSFPGPSAWSLAAAQPASLADAEELLDGILGDLKAIRAEIDRTMFDVDALSLKLAFEDAGTITKWVDDHVRFEQYVGLLRGPSGTLAARAGNALDQSVLVARLLQDAGYEATVVRGRIDPSDARHLLRGMFDSSPARDAPVLSEAAIEALDALGRAGGMPLPDASVSRIAESVNESGANLSNDPRLGLTLELTSRLRGLLEDARIPFADGDATALVEEAQDYFWVRYRLGGTGDWTDAHIAWPRGVDVPDVTATEVYTDAVPEALLHRISIQAFVERRIGNETSTRPIMDRWERPTANLLGVPITFTNLPDGVEGPTGLEDLDAALEETSFFIPMLNGELAPGAMLFDSLGNVVAPDVAASPYAGVFQSLSAESSRGAAALGALGSDDPQDDEALGLMGQWIHVVLISPDGRETAFRRDLFRAGRASGDSEPDSARTTTQKQDMGRDLMTQFTFMVAGGHLGSAFPLDATLERAIEMEPFLRFALSGSFDARGNEPATGFDLASLDASFAGHLQLLSTFDAFRNAETVEGAVLYRSEPTLVLHGQGVSDRDVVPTFLDVMNNTQRAVRATDDGVHLSPDVVMAQGVWDTHAESLRSGMRDAEGFNAVVAFQEASAKGSDFVVLAPSEVRQVEELELPEHSRRAIERDLHNGYVVVLPSPSEPKDDAAWWRVHPASGESLGMIGSGLGGQVSEDLTVRQIVFRTLGAGAGMFLGCYSIANDSTGKGIGCGICAAMLMAGMLLGYVVVIDIGLAVTLGAAVTWNQIIAFIYAKIMQVMAGGCSIVVTQFG